MSGQVQHILIGSPIRQDYEVLEKFLTSLRQLQLEGLELSYFFVNDNNDPRASELLIAFGESMGERALIQDAGRQDTYIRNETTHYWNDALIWRVAEFKNMMIQHALTLECDYLFLIDSDVLIHPQTLQHLVAAQKGIVSEIFWTRWQPDSAPQPQVWLRDQYTQWEQRPGEQLDDAQILERYEQFINRMWEPGLYEVGGLGACTLISREALLKGVNFRFMHNLSFWGEDRHFCIRAAALDIPLFVDTHYPAYHIYRATDLAGADQFLQNTSGLKSNLTSTLGAQDIDNEAPLTVVSPETHVTIIQPEKPRPARKRPSLTLSMVVKNEADRYLREALEAHVAYIDQAVIIDDGSSDNTLEVCLHALRSVPVRLIRNGESRFHNEVELRKQQWRETLEVQPEWILNLDADEIFENRFAEDIDAMLNRTDVDVFCFRLYDFWDRTHYREDAFWQSHLHYRPFLIRYREDFEYQWKETPQHCGRLPANIFELPHVLSPLRLKHLGWANVVHRMEKQLRYMQLDPEGRYGWKEQYDSILDEHPNVVEWKEVDD
ncbi:glycosyltransferase [Paenibacillus pini]|uniref:Glycosyltransferase n=1 Tax=Paenibacillus pini JCM 16418 TaxID=1236976 RepID=W7YPT6_9BACL|nr:glycosyltransferase [Paenibacillus pini]GAF10542.1 glycosyltransferase [Paenibacillus pini JCM 16418]